MPNLLELRKVDAFYGATQVLFGIELAIEAGSVTAMLGANGAGKTTTLRAISRIVRTSGDIVVEGRTVNRLKTEDIAGLGVAHVPDGRGTFTQLTVEENLRLGAYLRRDKLAVSRDIELMYGRFPKLADRRSQQAGTLSGGEQQMLAIGRALMLRPRLLLLDEPSFGVAPLVVEEIFSVLRKIRAEDQVSILLVEQNASLALQFADRAFLLETGRIIVSGSAAEVSANEDVRRSYLGY